MLGMTVARSPLENFSHRMPRESTVWADFSSDRRSHKFVPSEGLIMRAEFTPREVAELSGVTKAAVEKAIEERILGSKKALRGRRTRRVLSAHAVAYAKIVGAVKYRLDLSMKRRLAATLAKSGSTALRTLRFELEPAVEMDVGRLVGDAMERAERYGAARDSMIVEDENILGGTPVIRGTRISVYSVLGRVADGDTVEDIQSDYPELTSEVLETAIIYARTHPLVGRPAGRPWTTPE